MPSISKHPMLLRSTVPGEPPRINGAFTEEYGLSLEEISARPLLDWIHPDDRPALEHALQSGQGEVLARHETHQGQWRMLRWRVRTDAGRTVALAMSHSTHQLDIDVPQRLTTPKSTLTETLESMVRIVESKADGCRCSILLVESDGEHVSVGAGPSMPPEYNQQVQGLRIGPTVGSCGTAAFWNVPVVVENIQEDWLWKDLRDAAEIAGVSACWSVPVTGSTSEDVLGAMALYKDTPSAPGLHDMELLEISARMVGLAIERDRLEAQLREATKAEAIGVLAGGIAHDFNNLMSAVMGNAELTGLELPEDSPARLHLNRIIDTSVAASDLCKQMLAYAGQGSSLKESLDCAELVQELGNLMSAALSKKVSMIFEVGGDDLGVVGDQSHLRQVFMNLMTNASDAIEDEVGSIVVSVHPVTLAREAIDALETVPRLAPGDYVRVRVADSGAGMDPETKSKIFDPFFSTKSTGHGLGLAAVLGIVKSHRGAISVESTPGEGSTFSVWLPRVSLAPEVEARAPETTETPETATILVADDVDSVRMVAVSMLEKAGYKTVEARNGQEAVEIYRRDPEAFDCVLLDLNMPELDGAEAFAQLQGIRSDVRVILNSGFTEEEMLTRFAGAGLAGVIHKPAPMSVLLSKVEKALTKA